jgi:hypothetical protein
MGVGTGEIAASNGERSPQMDVIVYDAINSPVIHRSESGGIIVPVEGVHAVVEVTRHLDGRKLAQDAAKVASVKAACHFPGRSSKLSASSSASWKSWRWRSLISDSGG